MNGTNNPYQSPEPLSAVPVASDASPPRRVDGLALMAWPVVYGLNLVVPLLIGSDVTREHGRAGMWLAVVFLLAAGWAFCLWLPSAGRRVIWGAAVFALSQAFPIVQILAGAWSIGLAESCGMGVEPDEMIGKISNNLGGFVVTLLVGAMLLGCAASVGFLVGLVLPRAWLGRARR
ncbi:MAG: hypothetical protein AB7F89_02990 [Pirellulaceae bacterium]